MRDEKEIKVTKLEIQLADEKITLSTTDAKKLYEALSDLFSSKRVEVWHDYWWYHPHTVYCGSSLLDRQGMSNILVSQRSSAIDGQLAISGSTLQMSVNS